MPNSGKHINLGHLEDSMRAVKGFIEFKIDQASGNIILKDSVTGDRYVIDVQDGEVVAVSIPVAVIITKGARDQYIGESFNPSGMEFQITYEDSTIVTTDDITKVTYDNTPLSSSTTSVDIVFTERGFSFNLNVPVTMKTFSAAEVLIDFYYTDNGNETYTITGWKGTTNGVPGTQIIVPDSSKVIL